MLVPILLILTAILSAAAATYGTIPQWVMVDNGLAIIEWSRRLQWPLLTLAILCSIALLVLVISARRKPWWLIGLAPVVALLLQLFVTGTVANLLIVEQPQTVTATEAIFLDDDEYVVGFRFGDNAYALPYRQLYRCPVVLLVEREKRAIVFWSVFANRATAFQVNRQVKPRELDIVSMPANALLVYNARVGEFINGVTGQTLDGKTPYGFTHRIPVQTVPWSQWRALNPRTRVSVMPTLSTALPTPARPHLPMPLNEQDQLLAEQRVIFFPANPPVAIRETDVTDKLINVELGDTPVLMFRNLETGRLRIFERQFADRVSRFMPNPSRRRAAKGVFMLDIATNSGWTETGHAVDGEDEIIGQRLKPYTLFDEAQYYGVLKAWYPDLILLEP